MWVLMAEKWLHRCLFKTGNVYFDLQSRGDRYGKLVGVAPGPVGEPGGSPCLLRGFRGESQTFPRRVGGEDVTARCRSRLRFKRRGSGTEPRGGLGAPRLSFLLSSLPTRLSVCLS